MYNGLKIYRSLNSSLIVTASPQYIATVHLF
jgi:hypothetical protein